MNSIILSQNQTMSSKDIATASGKRHSDVIRDIRVMIDSIKDNAELRHDINQGLNEIKDERGYTKEFILDRFCLEVIVTGYDIERRAKILKRFMYLENKELNKQLKKATRQETKIEYKPMTNAIQLSHEQPKPYHFSNEADMINRIILGTTSSKFRKENDIGENEAIRDYMTTKQLEAFLSLQRANTVYIEDGIEYQERKDKLTALFNRKHKDFLIEEVHLINA
jgi:phage regulator Rha-like protein